MEMNHYLQLTGLPQLHFAHIFRTQDYRNRLDPGFYGMPDLEITYIAEGTLICSPDGGEPFAVPPHSILCNPFLGSLELSCDGRHEHHTVGFGLPHVHVDATVPGALCLPYVTVDSDSGKVGRLIDEIIVSHTMHTKGTLACTGLFLEILELLDRRARSLTESPAYQNLRYVKQAKAYIFEHLREPIRQADIAAHLGISPEYLCSVFKRTEGMPVMRYINRIKLEQIRILMENHRLSLAEASERFGYSDPNYVSRLHKQYFQFNITDVKKKGGNPPPFYR